MVPARTGSDRTGQADHVAHPIKGGSIDRFEFDPAGVVRVEGWGQPGTMDRVSVDARGGRRMPDVRRRVFRRDVTSELSSAAPFAGFVLDFFDLEGPVSLLVDGSSTGLHLDAVIDPDTPYKNLLRSPEVLHRDAIYGSGPPAEDVLQDVWALASRCAGPMLDFGCGRGHLVSRLRRHGFDAKGIEVRRPALEGNILTDVAGHVTLYDGTLPLPFEDDRFATVLAIEVIEHVPDHDACLDELARIASERLVMTVPDMSAIPLMARFGVVPWHLLEATHVNFFTAASLRDELRRRFETVDLFAVGGRRLAGAYIPGSIGAVATGHR